MVEEGRKLATVDTINLKFFLTFIGAVAYLQQQLFDEFEDTVFVAEVEPGTGVVNCNRVWEVGGIPIEDWVRFELDNQLYISGVVGHPQDFSTLVVWDTYDDRDVVSTNPKIGAFWTTTMFIWRPNSSYDGPIPKSPGISLN